MEKMYPILKRPKRKLCYLTTECPPKQWAGRLSLGDVDKMFDDIDPSLNNDTEELSPTSLLHIADTEANRSEPSVTQQEHRTKELPTPQMSPERRVLHPAFRPPSSDIDLDIPFKAHGPVKTSSPIEEKNVEGVEKLDNRKVGVMSPILFACEDDGKEEANAGPLRSQKCNGIDDSDFASPPSRVSLIKSKMSSHKNTVELCSREPQPLKRKTTKKPQTTELQRKITPRQKNRDPPMSAARHKPEVAAPVEKSEKGLMKPSVEVSSCVEKETTTFLQKLRDAGQPKPSCSRKSLTPVKVSSPPVPEDFLILEDDTPLWISIPSKASTNKRHSTDKNSSADKGANGSPKKTVTKQQGTEQPSQTVNQKVAKTKKNEKKNEAAMPGSGTDEVCSPEDVPASDLKEQVKANKKKRRLKEVPSRESDEAGEQPQDTGSRETKKPTENTEKKNKPKDPKRAESFRDGRENRKTSKSSKRAKKVTQETVRAEAANARQEQTSEERGHVEDLCFLDNEISNLEAQMNVKDKQDRLEAVSEESSSGDVQVIGKRRRRQPGQWWMSCSERPEETEVTDSQPTQKKQNKKESKAATASPVRGKKDRRGDQQPAPSSVQNTKTQKSQKGNKEKRNSQNKNVNRKGEAPVKMAVFDEVEAEEDKQHEIQELDPLHSSPLALTNRDLILNSDNKPFQSVYRHVAKQKMSTTPAVASPKRPKEQLLAAEPEKRRRKPPVNWWMVGASDDGQSSSLQQKVKPHKERKGRFKQIKSPGLGTPKSGNMAVSPRPPGGAPVSPLRMNPESAPKTASRSLATFKDIFTSVTETPLVIDSREAAQNNTHGVTTCPAVGVTVTDHATCSQAEAVVSVDAGEPNSPPNMDPQENSRYRPSNVFNALRSGPSSMIELEPYEDNDELNLPSTRVGAVLSASDLCAPPLKPLVLQPKDKASLTEWFKSLWSTPANSGPEITPDHFDWYFYQGRVIGIQVDLNCGSICNGKILLGSYTKKPLWVDHSATTVFNLLTGSVSVIINGRESLVNPAQSFMVQCAHAYSIQNVMAQPAVLYFTRIFAESSD